MSWTAFDQEGAFYWKNEKSEGFGGQFPEKLAINFRFLRKVLTWIQEFT